MGVTYFKRYRMEIDLTAPLFSPPPLPPGYLLLPWHDDLLEAHAEAKYRSFCGEIDAFVFPCLGNPEGCRRLMRDIVYRANFVPQATWLVAHRPPEGERLDYCGTIQGLRSTTELGAIQNLGVTPAHRGRGLGTILLHRALTGFRAAGVRQAYLEVTAQNEGAYRLYCRLGFRTVQTLYKASEVAFV